MKNETRKIEKYGIKGTLLDVEKKVENEEPTGKTRSNQPVIR